MSKKRTTGRAAPDGKQGGFGFAGTCCSQRLRLKVQQVAGFENPSGADLLVNGVPLADLLVKDHAFVLDLYESLARFDWSDFTKAYKPAGRRPIHPRIIVGLVLFGTLIGHNSLRDLEHLASRDLAAWFLCGGLRPDHSTIGKFLLKHLSLLTVPFFEKMTQAMLQELKIRPGGLGAFDGTVLAAAASRFSTVRAEAVRAAAAAARAEVARLLGTPVPAPQEATPAGEQPMTSTTSDEAPEESDEVPATVEQPPAPATDETPVTALPDEGQATVEQPMTAPADETPATALPDEGQATVEQPTAEPVAPELAAALAALKAAEHVLEVIEARARERKSKGQSAEATSISPGEVEAVLQLLKRGGYAPAYKPSIIVHESGLILAQKVDPSSETAVIAAMREQYQRVLQGVFETITADGNYHCEQVLELFIAAGEDILCPAGKREKGFVKQGAKGLFGKGEFKFDEDANSYTCPAGHLLDHPREGVDRTGRRLVTYCANKSDCSACPLKSQCTKAARRTVTRWSIDEYKDAMQQVLAHPAARRKLRKRNQIAERPFAVMKERQRLTRFHRRGLAKVSMEFSIHCVAQNFSRARSLRAKQAVVVLFFGRVCGQPWRIVGLGLVFG